MVMTGRAPDVCRHVPGTLEALRQAGADQPLERAEHCRPADVGMLPTDAVVQLLGRGLLAGLLQHGGNREPLRRQPDAGFLERRLRRCLNHTQMILRRFPFPPRYLPMASAAVPPRPWNRAAVPAGVVASILLPAGIFTWLLAHPAVDPSIVVPGPHFVIVTAVSLLALGLAVLLAIAAVQIAQYRVLFLCLGFMAMGGIFAVHGIDTPGILKRGADAPYAGNVLGVSAYLSLFVPALLFAASYTPLTAAFERRLPFSPAGWLIVLLGTALAIYGALAIAGTELIAELPFGVRPYSTAMGLTTIALLAFSAQRQAGSYLVARLPLQGILVMAFILLAEAQVIMMLGQVWRLSWWEYHVLMLVAVGLAVWSLTAQRAKGQSLRSVMEATLELEVKVGVELEHAESIAALAAAVEAKDENTKGHNTRVAELAVRIGRAMELPTDTLRTLARAGLLHDVGKIGIPDAILNKPGALDAAEWTIIKRHPALGHEILSRVPSLHREAEIVIAHHERVDGSGYPRGLRGEAIPLEARILAVADTFDVLTSNRPYRQAFDNERAVRILREESGTHLWEPAVRALLRSLGERSDDWTAAA
jgi:HD-GYP domain-containing protein (c-di-GMP phosphodiesterase class II)